MFEIIIALVVLWFIGSLMGGTKSGTKKSSKPATKDFIKQDSYNIEDAANVVFNYAYALGHSKKSSEEIANHFKYCFNAVIKENKKEQSTWKEEWMKGYQWYQKRIDKLNDDCSPVMKKFMNLLRSSDYADAPLMIEWHDVTDHMKLQDPPNSVYDDDGLDDEEMEKKRRAWEAKNK